MIPLKLVSRMFLFDDEDLPPEIRAQRVLNKARVPSMANYVVSNPVNYVFSAITVSVDADVEFEPLSSDPKLFRVGTLHIPLTAKFLINDGQHRRAAIELALKQNAHLGNESISCVLYEDAGLKRAQQMFSDLNRYPVRTTSSISILYDHRDPFAELARTLAREIPVFRDRTELDKANISNRSPKVFTLSGIYRATKDLMEPRGELDATLATEFWRQVAKNVTEWEDVRNGKVHAADLRRNSIVAHTVALIALGRAGGALIRSCPDGWKEKLSALKDVDWRRENAELWEGRATIGGRISIANNHLTLLCNVIKMALGVPLSREEQAVEARFQKAGHGDKVEV